MSWINPGKLSWNRKAQAVQKKVCFVFGMIYYELCVLEQDETVTADYYQRQLIRLS